MISYLYIIHSDYSHLLISPPPLSNLLLITDPFTYLCSFVWFNQDCLDDCGYGTIQWRLVSYTVEVKTFPVVLHLKIRIPPSQNVISCQ